MRIGIIGLQGHVNYFLQGARQVEGARVVAVSNSVRAAAEKLVAREPLAEGAEVYEDWRHLIEHSLMDVCVVAAENGERVEQLVELAKRGIHIVAEKPLTTTLDDLGRVRQALDASQSRLTMLLTMRHDAKYWTMKNLIQQGVVGEVRQVTCQKSYRLGQRPAWFKSRDRLGGTIPYIGVHALDLMSWVTGLKFTQVAAFHATGGRPQMVETEDTASILVRYEGGASGTARLDYLRPETAPSHGDDRLRIAGTSGVLEIAYPDPDPLLITSNDAPMRVALEPTDHLFVDFVRSLREDLPARITDADCFNITEVVLRARQAADEQTMINLS